MSRGEIMVDDRSYLALAPEAAAQQRHDDAVAVAAAAEADADLFVTNRPFLLSGNWSVHANITVCDLTDALAHVGFFLRSRAVYIAWATPDRGPVMQFNRGLYFWVATRTLLPEGWRWFSHCVRADDHGPESDLTVLAQSAFQRVQRALRARDSLIRHMSKPQDNDVAEDALIEMDTILVLLMGAFDAMARVAHRAAALSTPEFHAGWQKGRWIQSLAQEAPALAALVSTGTKGADVLEVLRLLRNTVHGAALQPLGLSRGLGPRSGTAVTLPARDVETLVSILRRRGWDSDWGLTQFGERRFHVTPDLVVEHVMRSVLPLMNALMAETPVEALGPDAVDHTVSDGPPQSTSLDDPFAPRFRQSLALQLGF
jgi:hypothetical protein